MKTIPHWALLIAGLALAVSPALAKPATKAKKPVAAKKAPAQAAKPAPKKAAEPENGPPAVGQKAPDFTLMSGDEKSHTLSDYRGRWVLLNFYPANFTGG